jgi:hypothetical protein
MQTRIGVELSSPTCLIRYRLFYSREILLLSGCYVSAQVGALRGGYNTLTEQHFKMKPDDGQC